MVTSGIQCIKPAPSLPPITADEETKDERQQQQQSSLRAGGGGVIVDGEGKEHPVDVIIYATGFRVRDAMEQVKAVGLYGMDLQERYRYVLCNGV